MTESEDSERRRARRLSNTVAYVEAQAYPPTEGGTSAFIFFPKNISKGGLMFRSFQSLAVSTSLTMDLYLPTCNAPLELQGKVVRVNRPSEEDVYEVAIAFGPMKEEDKKELRKYLVANSFPYEDYEVSFDES